MRGRLGCMWTSRVTPPRRRRGIEGDERKAKVAVVVSARMCRGGGMSCRRVGRLCAGGRGRQRRRGAGRGADERARRLSRRAPCAAGARLCACGRVHEPCAGRGSRQFRPAAAHLRAARQRGTSRRCGAVGAARRPARPVGGVGADRAAAAGREDRRLRGGHRARAHTSAGGRAALGRAAAAGLVRARLAAPGAGAAGAGRSQRSARPADAQGSAHGADRRLRRPDRRCRAGLQACRRRPSSI